MSTTRVLGICASLRQASVNRALLHCAMGLAPEGMSLDTFDRLGDIPPYNQDVQDQGWPDAVAELRAGIGQADGLLIVSPEYNYSIPGVLKNAIDWASRPPEQPFEGKPIAIMGASPGGIGTARGQREIRNTFTFLDGRVMNQPEVMVPGAYDKIEDGKVTDEKTREFVAMAMQAFGEWIDLHKAGA